MRRSVGACLGAIALLVCAGCGESTQPSPVQLPPVPVPALTLNPGYIVLLEGSSALTIEATLSNAEGEISWSLSPEVGALSATSGGSVTYTPPESVEAETIVTLTAKAGDLQALARIAIYPVGTEEPLSTITVSPATAAVPGGGTPVELSAALENVTGTVLWSLSPAVGSLSATNGLNVHYTPPADVDSVVEVTAFAHIGNLVSQAVITVRPAPKLTVSPKIGALAVGGAPLPLTATLLNSSDTITWTLASGSVGSLSATTGSTVTYSAPAVLGLPATVIVTAAAAGLTAEAIINVNPELGDQDPPLLNKRFVPFSRVVEYLTLGTTFDGTQDNAFVIDPYRAFGNVDDQPISLPPGVVAPNHAQLHKSQNSDVVVANRKVARAGGLDDDFVDETVLLTWLPGDATQSVAKLSILDASLSETDPTADPVLTTVVPIGVDLAIKAGQTKTDYDLALADVDADGYDEIVVVGAILWTQGDTTVHSGKLWTFDDLKHGCALLKTVELKGDLAASYRGVAKAKVAAGSMKADRSVQIVVGWYDREAYQTALNLSNNRGGPGIGAVSFAFFEADDLTQIGNNHKTSVSLISNKYDAASNPNLFNLALADVDGDLRKELAFAGWNSAWNSNRDIPNSWLKVQLFDDLDHLGAGDAPTSLVGPIIDPGGIYDINEAMLRSYPERFLLPIDYNGDRAEELLVGPFPGRFTASPAAFTWESGSINPFNSNNPGNLFTAESNYLRLVSDVGVGDVNGDKREDFLVLYKSGQVQAWGQRDRLVSVSGTPLQKNYAEVPDFKNLDVSGSIATSAYDNTATLPGILVPVNVDNDSMMLEYAANASQSSLARSPELVAHRLVYGDNKIIALLAAPPIDDEFGQDTGNSETTFGTNTGSSTSSGAEFSTRAGVLFGSEFELSAGLGVNTTTFSLEIEIESQLEYTNSHSWSASVSQSVSDSAGDGDDIVIFSTTPYDRYTYRVAAAPNPSLVDTTIDVDVPRTTQMLAVSRPTFNRDYSNGGLQITRDLLRGTPYDLASYPRKADVPTTRRTSIIDVGNGLRMASTVIPFGRSGPYNISENAAKSCEIEISHDEAWSEGVTYSLDFMAKVSVMGASAGVSAGFSAGGYLERSTSNGIFFSASVPGLPSAYYTEANKYSWGMYAYKQTLRDDQAKVAQDFFVVNYWVGPFGEQW